MIELKNISKIYNEGKENQVKALDDVSLTIEKGECVAIMGVSGSGKTTMMNIIGCILQPTSGEVYLNGTEVSKMNDFELSAIRNKMLGIVMQNNFLLENEKVINNIKIPLSFNKKIKIRDYNKRAESILSLLGILNLKTKKVRELSGGQKQRVAIARAMVNDPEVILADEPTSALDSNTASEIIGVLKDLQAKGKTIIVITHDINVANKMDRIITIKDGKIVD